MWAWTPPRPRRTRSNQLRLELTRSGGFAGLTTSMGTLDTSEMPEGEARKVEELYRAAPLDELARRAPASRGGADRFQYHLTVEDDDGRREHTVREDEVPDGLRPLIERVQAAGGDAG
jgi:hypothetical protein